MSSRMNHSKVNSQQSFRGTSFSTNKATTGKVSVWYDGGVKEYRYHSDYAASDGLGISLTDLHNALGSGTGKLQTNRGEVEVCWTAHFDALCRAYNRD